MKRRNDEDDDPADQPMQRIVPALDAAPLPLLRSLPAPVSVFNVEGAAAWFATIAWRTRLGGIARPAPSAPPPPEAPALRWHRR